MEEEVTTMVLVNINPIFWWVDEVLTIFEPWIKGQSSVEVETLTIFHVIQQILQEVKANKEVLHVLNNVGRI